MIKDFQRWNIQKIDLNDNKARANFHERDIWFATVGANIGFEQDGKGQEFLRPIIVVKKFNNDIFWGVPTTKKEKIGKYYLKVLFNESYSTNAILSQLRLADCKRLKYQIGIINEGDFDEMKKRIITFLG